MVGPPPLLRAAISVSMVVDPPAGKSHHVIVTPCYIPEVRFDEFT